MELNVFLSNVFKTRTCWFWIGALRTDGYGTYGKPKELAHRISWRIYRGPIPVGKMVLHDCDTPQCVNPNHLFLGRQKENMADASTKGRVGNQNGLNACQFVTKHGMTLTLKDWAHEVGISYLTIYKRIKRGWSAELAIDTIPGSMGRWGPL